MKKPLTGLFLCSFFSYADLKGKITLILVGPVRCGDLSAEADQPAPTLELRSEEKERCAITHYSSLLFFLRRS